MWEEILRLAVGNGLWAVLFCVLLFYLIRESKRREERYISIINTLGDRLKVVNEVRSDAEEIKTTVKKLIAVKAKPEARDAARDNAGVKNAANVLSAKGDALKNPAGA